MVYCFSQLFDGKMQLTVYLLCMKNGCAQNNQMNQLFERMDANGFVLIVFFVVLKYCCLSCVSCLLK